MDCWNEDENIRPDFKNIKNRLKPILAGLLAFLTTFFFYSRMTHRSHFVRSINLIELIVLDLNLKDLLNMRRITSFFFIKSFQMSRSANIFDNMLAIMEKYAKRLEFLVEERTMQLAEEKRKLAEEKKKTETLLLSMLPVWVQNTDDCDNDRTNF